MKYALITGSSFGIGKSCAFFFAKQGYNLILTYLSSKEESLELKEELEKEYNIQVKCYYLDLRDEESITSLYNELLNNNIHINLLINNAAIAHDNNIADKTKEEFMDVLETNVVGTFLVTKYLSKLMDENDYIINISSTDAIDTYTDLSIDYSASKAALNNMTKSLSNIIKPKIIALCPNWVNTEAIKEMNPDYLKKEMNRVHQDKLIEPITIPKKIKEVIDYNTKTGTIIRIEGDDNE